MKDRAGHVISFEKLNVSASAPEATPGPWGVSFEAPEAEQAATRCQSRSRAAYACL